MLRAVVAVSAAEVLLDAMAQWGALFGTWYLSSFFKAAAAVVEKDVDRAHFDFNEEECLVK
ncbi:hypothetical protein N7533_005929 [Penicillium manginii]|jgi:hypothetical protein|uniref:uncharacterized protein n=1 Tax=Penicillium manginii TaxID=203109 RepID=UPI00254811EB|nr:uncharacterized protein N7533_005929 [Penicillium manginii]KAJ5756386.1 hypothetical protein N7533_005929 [Penicillium manginii]